MMFLCVQAWRYETENMAEMFFPVQPMEKRSVSCLMCLCVFCKLNKQWIELIGLLNIELEANKYNVHHYCFWLLM